MSHTNRNFVVAYVLLVGLPLLGLVGILRKGRALSAPFSVNGTWKIEAEADSTQLAGLPCAKSVSHLSNSLLLISQSGKSLSLTLNPESTATGVIEGTTITASLTPRDNASARSSNADCGNDDTLTLTATLDPKSNPRSLRGTLSVDACASCAPVEFRALRQPLNPGDGTR
jgi:hypothetical protein